MSLQHYIDIVTQGTVLSEQQAEDAFDILMRGDACDPDMALFLTRLADRGEHIDEIYAATKVLRQKLQPISAPPATLDCCGTGGDGLHTLNISTAVALVVAACGVPVAKHGNRAASSQSGAADVLETLGVPLDVPRPALERALKQTGFCFLMAPAHHPAMKHVAAVRRTLGRRTIFNLLGPLANPAGATRQLIGVYDPRWLRPVAEVLNRLGTQKAWIVHGADGMDEISLSGKTAAIILEDGHIREETLTPADFGLPLAPAHSLRGGDAACNAAALRALLNGDTGPYRDIVLANAAAALCVADRVPDLETGVEMAANAIDKSNAINVLQNYIQVVCEQ